MRLERTFYVDSHPCQGYRKTSYNGWDWGRLSTGSSKFRQLEPDGANGEFNLILWVLYTGMQWKCLPVPTDAQGNPAIHYTTVYKVFAKWADDGSLWQAFLASVRH